MERDVLLEEVHIAWLAALRRYARMLNDCSNQGQHKTGCITPETCAKKLYAGDEKRLILTEIDVHPYDSQESQGSEPDEGKRDGAFPTSSKAGNKGKHGNDDDPAEFKPEEERPERTSVALSSCKRHLDCCIAAQKAERDPGKCKKGEDGKTATYTGKDFPRTYVSRCHRTDDLPYFLCCFSQLLQDRSRYGKDTRGMGLRKGHLSVL